MDAVEKLHQITGALSGDREARPQQEEMVRRIEAALLAGTPIAVQAGTGVGKTFGYLTPAIAHARATGQRVVVVTSSIALQDQLARKDLPFLQAHHPDPFSWVVLKGRGNYLCEASLAEVRRHLLREDQGTFDLAETLDLADGDGVDDDERTDARRSDGAGAEPAGEAGEPSPLARVDRDQLAAILQWSGRTTSGDRAELGSVIDAEPDAATWGAVSVAPGACPGADRCAHGDKCLYEKRRHTAQTVDVLVVNAHLYGAHLALGGDLLPDHRVVVIDEAHEFVDAAIGALSVELSRGRVAQLLRVVRDVVDTPGPEVKALDAAAQRFHETATRMADARREVNRPMRLEKGISEDPDLYDSVVALVPPLVALMASLKELRERVAAMDSSGTGRIDGAVLAVTTFHTEILDRFLEPPSTPGDVVYLERTDRHCAVKATTIAIASRLESVVWHSGVVPILTSATLPRTVADNLGLHHAPWVDVGTPFPFRDNALLYVPKRFPEPRGASMDAWRARATAELLDIIEAAGGRTLALFTTSRAVGDAARAARARFPELTILAQGELPKAELTRRFIEEETACLFATASFWTGIDAQGATLRAVVIDKLPFPVPTDPIIQAKEELVGSDDSFGLVSVPAAAVQLAQGAGRLIRTAQDRGVVAVLDPRLATKGYRRQILACLPPMKRTIDRDEVLAFLRALAD